MKSEFWATVVACIVTFVIAFIVWLLYGKPTIIDNTATSMIGCLAVVALCYSIRNNLLRNKK